MYSIPDAKSQHIPQLENGLKAAFYPLTIILLFYLSHRFGSYIDSIESTGLTSFILTSVKWFGVAMIITGICILMNGIGVLAHDGVHRVLFRSRFANDAVCSIISAFVFIPFFSNRQFHLTHHKFSHQPGRDPENIIHDRPYLIALFAGPFFALYAQYRILFTNLFQFNDRKAQLCALSDLVCASTNIIGYRVAIAILGMNPDYTLIPLIIILPLSYNFRAMSDHYGIPAMNYGEQDSRENENVFNHQLNSRVILTTPLLEWLWSHVNYHEVHHRYPFLSHTHLPRVFAETKDEVNYAVVNGYTRSLLSLRKLKYYP